MPDQTLKYGLPYPVSSDVPDVPSDMRKLAEALESALDFIMDKIAFPIGTILPLGPGVVPPPGWFLCNGQNGTPNLAGKTLVGAGVAVDATHAVLASGQSASYVAGQIGGFAAVKLTDVTSGIGIHQHVGNATVTIPEHAHTVPGQSVLAAEEGWNHTHSGWSGGMNRSNPHAHGAGAHAGGHHQHQVKLLDGNAESGRDGQGVDSSPVQGWNNYQPNGETMGSDGGHGHGIDVYGSDINHEHHTTVGTASANHQHWVTTAQVTTHNAAPVGGATISMQESQPKDAQQAHENRSPFYVVQYIMRMS